MPKRSSTPTKPAFLDIPALRSRCTTRKPDPFDAFLPEKGYLAEFVSSLFNSESPALYGLWAGIWTLAMAIKREAWIRWFEDDPLFPNFYIILSGPPSNKKGKAISRAVHVYTAGICPIGRYGKNTERPEYRGKLKQPWAIVTKSHVPIIRDSATTRPLKEALDCQERKLYGHEFGIEFPLLFSSGKPLLDSLGNPVKYRKTSEIGIIAEELSTFLGKQQYNEGLVQLLLSIYSTELDREDRTALYGVIRMHGLCTNFLAATTPVSFQQAVAETARGDGFLSRTLIAHVPRRYQQFFPPPQWDFLPSVEDLAERLAFIAENRLGEHVLSPSATRLAQEWYKELSYRLRLRPDKEAFMSRADVSVLKLSLLLKAQRYCSLFDNEIEESDVLGAIRILEGTLASTPGIWVPKHIPAQQIRMVSQAIAMQTKPIKFRKLISYTHLPTYTVEAILSDLVFRGKVRVASSKSYSLTPDIPKFIPDEGYSITDRKEDSCSEEEEEEILYDP